MAKSKPATPPVKAAGKKTMAKAAAKKKLAPGGKLPKSNKPQPGY